MKVVQVIFSQGDWSSDIWDSICAAIQRRGVDPDVPGELGGDAETTVGHCGVGRPAHRVRLKYCLHKRPSGSLVSPLPSDWLLIMH